MSRMMTTLWWLAFALLVAGVLAMPRAEAATIAATPATIAADIAAAGPGDTLALGVAAYPQVKVLARAFDPPLVIDATGASIETLIIQESTGVTVNGGTFVPSKQRYGSTVLRSRRVTLVDGTYIGRIKSLVVAQSTDIVLRHNLIRDFTTDGINIAASQRVLTEDNVCSTFATGQAHPDCIQLWSAAGLAPTADVTIRNNIAVGWSQGFNGFDASGVGFDRLTITGNVGRLMYPNHAGARNCRGCTITGNDVARLPGANFRAAVNVIGGSGNTVCANKMPDLPSANAAQPC